MFTMAPAQRVSARQPKDVRAEFDLAFRRFSQSMDMLLPDQRALAYNADLRWLGKIRGTARARYRDDRLDLAGCGEKVRQLIADAVVADGIQILVKEVQLFSPEFEEKVEALKTDEAKASEMEARHPSRDQRPRGREPGLLSVAARAAGRDH